MKTRKKKAVSSPQSALGQNHKPHPAQAGPPVLHDSGTHAAVLHEPAPQAEPAKRKRTRQGKFTLKDLDYPDQRVVRFPMVEGKTADTVELLTSKHLHYITVEFADRTALSFMIEPTFTFTAAYEYLEKGKPRAKMWNEIRSK